MLTFDLSITKTPVVKHYGGFVAGDPIDMEPIEIKLERPDDVATQVQVLIKESAGADDSDSQLVAVGLLNSSAGVMTQEEDVVSATIRIKPSISRTITGVRFYMIGVGIEREGLFETLQRGELRPNTEARRTVGFAVVANVGTPDAIEVTAPNGYVTLYYQSGPVDLSAVAVEADGAILTGVEFTWISSDESIATVDEHGVVTFVGDGDVTITAIGRDVAGTLELHLTREALAVAGDDTLMIAEDDTLMLFE